MKNSGSTSSVRNKISAVLQKFPAALMSALKKIPAVLMSALKKIPAVLMPVLKKLVPHLLFIFSLVIATLLILHLYNPRMGFLTSTGSVRILGIYVLLSLSTALYHIWGK